MKARRAEVERAFRSPAGEVRLFLFHGPDQAGSDDLAARAVTAFSGERVWLSVDALKDDPSLLAGDAASLSLFGERRIIVVEGASDAVLPAVERLLVAPVAGDPVILTAANLKKASKLLALAEASAAAVACASYVPERRDAERLVADIGQKKGLRIAGHVARRIADAAGGDRAIIEHELDKFALYLDAAPERQATLDDDAVDALSAEADGHDVTHIVDAALDGDLPALERQAARAPSGSEIVLVRALMRRVIALARLRAQMEDGNSVGAVMASSARSLFRNEKEAVERQLGTWRGSGLALAMRQFLDAERAHKSPGGVGANAIDQAIYAVAQQAARRR